MVRTGKPFGTRSSHPRGPAPRPRSRPRRGRRRACARFLPQLRPGWHARCGPLATKIRACAEKVASRFSQRITLTHWLIRIGRSRYDCTHSEYIVPMMTSEVGRIASRSVSCSPPPSVTQATSGAKPSTCSASRAKSDLRNEQREVGVFVARRLETPVQFGLQAFPQPVSRRAAARRNPGPVRARRVGMVADGLIPLERSAAFGGMSRTSSGTTQPDSQANHPSPPGVGGSLRPYCSGGSVYPFD